MLTWVSNVGDLKKALEGLPGDTPVLFQGPNRSYFRIRKSVVQDAYVEKGTLNPDGLAAGNGTAVQVVILSPDLYGPETNDKPLPCCGGKGDHIASCPHW